MNHKTNHQCFKMNAPVSIVHNLQIFHCLTLFLTESTSIIYSQIDLFIQIPYVKLDFAELTVDKDYFKEESAIFILEYVNDYQLGTLMEILTNSTEIHPKTKFFIIGHNFTSESASTMYSYFFVDVLFADIYTMELFTYSPFSTQNTRQIDSSLFGVGLCQNDKNIFLDKNPKSWNNFTLYLAYRRSYPYTNCIHCDKKGIDTDVILTICHFLKIITHTVRITSVKEWTEAYESKKYDVMFGNVEYILPFTYNLYPFYSQYVAIFTPISGYIPRWKYIFYALDLKSYFLFFISSILILFCVMITTPVQHKAVISEVFTIISVIFIDQSIMISRLKLRRRYQLMFILVLSTMMNTFYKCGFTHLLSFQILEKNIESLEELYSSNLKVGLTKLSLNCFNQTPEAAQYLKDHFVSCDLSTECIRRAAIERDMAVLKPTLTVNSLGNIITNPQNGLLLKAIEPGFILYHNTAIVSRGYVVYELMDKLYQRMVEHGLTQKIISGYLTPFTKYEEKFPRKISMEFFVVPMLGWLIGILLGITILSGEYIYRYIK